MERASIRLSDKLFHASILFTEKKFDLGQLIAYVLKAYTIATVFVIPHAIQ